MWIVRLALARPFTVAVMSLLIALVGGLSIVTMAKDVFPKVDIPVVALVWGYDGMGADEIEKRLVLISERSITTTVNNIEHMESQSLNGIGIIKVFMHAGTDIASAVAQITSVSQTVLAQMPQGTTPPFIIQFSATNVPVVQIGVSSEQLSQRETYDIAQNIMAPQLVTVRGAQVPSPYGGARRQIMVDIDFDRMQALGISALDVSAAIAAQNLILPAGTARIGTREYMVRLNNSPDVMAALNDLPIKTVEGRTVYVRDLAQVRNGTQVQENIVRANGTKGSLLTIYKAAETSTLAVVQGVRDLLPLLQGRVPEGITMTPLFDQSIFVREALFGVIEEAAIAATLTAMMILLFLGSWRSTFIVILSIPLSILTSIGIMNVLGETLNTMTLGGLALAVGILVDDSTVEIENIHRNLGMKKKLRHAILDGAEQIAAPAFVATLSICIVFVPVTFITGAAKYLFTPLAMAVVFAMLTSYLLSRTLVPTTVDHLLKKEAKLYADGEEGHAKIDADAGFIWRTHSWFIHHFENLRHRYSRWLDWSLGHRGLVAGLFAVFVVASLALFPFIGRDFFPRVDGGQIRMHLRLPGGTRIEETDRAFGEVSEVVREIIPADELEMVLENIGIIRTLGLVFGDGSTVGVFDGEILIAMNEHHKPSEHYEQLLRERIHNDFPNIAVFFPPADITNQILNFGRAAPVDVQVIGNDRAGNYALAKQLAADIALLPGAADVRVHQIETGPELRLNIDRVRAMQLGLTQNDIARNVLVALSSSSQSAPNFWLDRNIGVSYRLAVQTPQYRVRSMNDLQRIPIMSSRLTEPQMLSNVADVERRNYSMIIDHYDIQPMFNVFASTDRTDLGSLAAGVEKIVKKASKNLPRGTVLKIRGQVESMETSFSALAFGMILAVVLVYLLMVVNFQSWIDPLIILMALPGTFAGILWMLFVTHTTLSVPALMGAVMAIGVATSNSILMVVFANDERQDGHGALSAALSAGRTRLRPVVMTALAMVLGMLPMSLGLGAGGEQYEPLGRAVIGGLSIATFSTLFFVPVMYSLMRKKAPKKHVGLDQVEHENDDEASDDAKSEKDDYAHAG